MLHDEHLAIITRQLAATGAAISRNPTNDLLMINSELTISLTMARCRELRETDHRWTIHFDTSLDPDITIAARMAPGNAQILDYYLFPNIDALASQCRLAYDNGLVLDVYRAADLSALNRLARYTLIPEAP